MDWIGHRVTLVDGFPLHFLYGVTPTLTGATAISWPHDFAFWTFCKFPFLTCISFLYRFSSNFWLFHILPFLTYHIFIPSAFLNSFTTLGIGLKALETNHRVCSY